MLCGTATGELLPPYVVYKSKRVWDTWQEGGVPGAKYDCTKSGWFDGTTFSNFFFRLLLPHARKKSGTKVVICDNLSSHVDEDVIKACRQYNIKFVFLPPNTTHWTQPLDVAFFAPMKKKWRSLLSRWKKSLLQLAMKKKKKATGTPRRTAPATPESTTASVSPNNASVTSRKRNSPKHVPTSLKKKCSPKTTKTDDDAGIDKNVTLPKDKFPRLLKQLWDEISPTAATNLVSGFRSCGIVPLDCAPLLKKLPKVNHVDVTAVGEGFIDFVQQYREEIVDTGPTKRRKVTNIVAGT